MPGLLNATQSAAPPAAAPQGAAASPLDDLLPGNADKPNAKKPGADDGNVPPEEQQQYTEFVTNGMNLLYDKKGTSKILESIRGDDNPVEGLANTVASIVIRVEDSAVQKGIEISLDVLHRGGAELLEQAADLANKAGIHEFSDDDLENALNIAMDIYRTTRQQQGKLPTEQFGQDLQELQAAEQDGSLEQMIPGITKYSQKRRKEPPANAQPPGGSPAAPGGPPAPGGPVPGRPVPSRGGLLR